MFYGPHTYSYQIGDNSIESIWSIKTSLAVSRYYFRMVITNTLLYYTSNYFSGNFPLLCFSVMCLAIIVSGRTVWRYFSISALMLPSQS